MQTRRKCWGVFICVLRQRFLTVSDARHRASPGCQPAQSQHKLLLSLGASFPSLVLINIYCIRTLSLPWRPSVIFHQLVVLVIQRAGCQRQTSESITAACGTSLLSAFRLLCPSLSRSSPCSHASITDRTVNYILRRKTPRGYKIGRRYES